MILGMDKIKVKNPIVEIDGDEMARVIWHWIKESLILPYLDIDLKYFDYHILHRDATEDRVVAEAAEAIRKYRVGVKCAAINPDQERVTGAGAAAGIYNTQESVRGFALSCLNFGLERGLPVYLGTKNTILETYDGLFKNTFQEVYDTRFRTRFEERGIGYEHRMVDELAAFAVRSSGGFVWACKNYDGDIQSDMVAAGFGSLGLMASILLTPDGKTVLTEAAHGTITRHFRDHQARRETSTNPIASLFAWTRAIYYRGLFDATPAVQRFALTLEKACIDTVEAGNMTKDLATLTGGAVWLTTRQFLETIRESLDRKLSSGG